LRRASCSFCYYLIFSYLSASFYAVSNSASFFFFSISSFNFSPSAVYALYFSSSFSLGSLVTAATFATTGTGLLRLYFFSKFLTHG
jgi:hypothetical protein